MLIATPVPLSEVAPPSIVLASVFKADHANGSIAWSP